MEIMIVIFLITLITGAIGYNMKGSLDKGKKFKTEMAEKRLHEMLLIALSEGQGTAEQIKTDPIKYIKQLGIVSDPDSAILDGWGKKFNIEITKNGTDFEITKGK